MQGDYIDLNYIIWEKTPRNNHYNCRLRLRPSHKRWNGYVTVLRDTTAQTRYDIKIFQPLLVDMMLWKADNALHDHRG